MIYLLHQLCLHDSAFSYLRSYTFHTCFSSRSCFSPCSQSVYSFQPIKQCVLRAYKILFLDVLIPLGMPHPTPHLFSHLFSHLVSQSEKQRIIWAYKILFLDVLFPLGVNRIIFVDSDQVIRTDLGELMDMDIK